jgi:hypothetical protein
MTRRIKTCDRDIWAINIYPDQSPGNAGIAEIADNGLSHSAIVIRN